MTIGEFKDALFRHLDVDDDEEKQKYFPVAINHSLDTVCTVFPLSGKYLVEPRALQNKISETAEYTKVSGDTIDYEADAKAFYFEVSGVGYCDVIDNDGLRRIEFDSNGYKEYRGFCNGPTKLSFHSDYVFFVRNVALYDILLSSNEEDIPAYTTSILLDFRELTKVENEDGTFFVPFNSFMPEKFEEKTVDGRNVVPYTDFEVEPDSNGHLLRLFGDAETQKIIYYRKNFTPITDATDETTEIEIPQGLVYVLLDFCVYRMNVDESDISVDRARYEASQLLNWKQQQNTGENVVGRIVDEKGYLNYD